MTKAEPATALVFIVNVELVLPLGMVTLDETLATDALSLLSDTTTPPLNSGLLNVTVPCDVLPPKTLVGLSESELNAGGAELTVRVTFTVCGVFVAADADTVMFFV